jgi:acetolactate synthase small subunit
MFNTGWDPHDALLQTQHNIGQLAVAYNEHKKQLDEVRALVTHQQDIIQQIVHQNNKLNQILAAQRHEMTRLNAEIQLLRAFPNNTQ